MKKYLHICGSFSSGGITSFVKALIQSNSSSPTIHYVAILKHIECDLNEYTIDISDCRYNIIKALKFASKSSKEYEKIFIHSADYLLTFAFMISNSYYYLFQHGMAVSHGNKIKRFLKKLWFSLIPFLLNAKIICSTEYAYAKTRSKGVYLSPERVKIIPFGTNMPRRREISQKKCSNQIIVGTAGRLAPIKRFDILLKSLCNYSGERQIELRIAGEGPEREKLFKISNRIKNHRVTFVFMGEMQKMSDFYDGLDLFIFPSHNESYGLVVLESLFRNIPVALFSDIGGALHLINDGKNGFVLDDIHTGLSYLWEKVNTDPEILSIMSRNICQSDYSKLEIKSTKKALEEVK